MPFKKTSELGQKDPNIAPGGINWQRNPDKFKPRTYKSLGRQELEKLLRKVKPYSTEAVQVLYRMLTNEKTPETTKMKAAWMILQMNKELIVEAYTRMEDETLPEAADDNVQAPSARLFVIDPRRNENSE